MKISVQVKLKSKKEEVQKIDDKKYIVFVKEMPIEDKANKAVINALSDFLKIPKSTITIISGKKSKNKIIEI